MPIRSTLDAELADVEVALKIEQAGARSGADTGMRQPLLLIHKAGELPVLCMHGVKETGESARRRRRTPITRISAKNQATLPVDVLRRTGLRAGDKVRVTLERAGRIVLEQAKQALRRWAGCLTWVYPKGYLTELRREWR